MLSPILQSSKWRAIALASALLLTSCDARREEQAADSGADKAFCEAVSEYVTPQDCEDFTLQAERQMPGKAAFNAPHPLKRGDTFTVWLAVAAEPPEPRPTSPPPAAAIVLPSTPAPDQQMVVRPEEPTSEVATEPATGTEPSSEPEVPANANRDPAAEDEEYIAPDPSDIIGRMSGHPEYFSAVVGDYVAAELDGDASFEIKPASERIQRVKLGRPWPSTIWKWHVTAKRGGNHTMTLSTAVQVRDRNGKFHEIESTPRAFAFDVQVTPLDKARDILADAPGWMKLIGGVFAAAALLLGTVKDFRNALFSLFRKEETDEDKPSK